MKLRLKSTPAARALIREYEPFRAAAERDANGRWTVGYGHRAGAREDTTVSRDDADLLLIYDVLQAEKAVDESINDLLQAPQRDALVSFALGIGLTAFRQSAVVRLINKGRWSAAADAIAAWGGGDNPRHDAERELFRRDLPADISGRPVELVIEVEHPDFEDDDEDFDTPETEAVAEDTEDEADDASRDVAEDETGEAAPEAEFSDEAPDAEEADEPEAEATESAPASRPAPVPAAPARSAVAERVIARMRDQLAIREPVAEADQGDEPAEDDRAPVNGPVGFVFVELAKAMAEDDDEETPEAEQAGEVAGERPPLTANAARGGEIGDVGGPGPSRSAQADADTHSGEADERLPQPEDIAPEFEAGSVVPNRNGWTNGDDSPAPAASGFPTGTVSVLGIGVLAFGVGVWDTASRWGAYSSGDLWPFGPATAAAGFVLTGAAAIGLISRTMRKN